MKKPDSDLIRLYEIGVIKSISVNYKQTGTETASDFVTFTGSKGEIKDVRWSHYKCFLDLEVWCGSVARIKHCHAEDLRRWFEFEQENRAELAEYERLKKKFS